MRKTTITLIIVCVALGIALMAACTTLIPYSIEMTIKYNSLVDKYNQLLDKYNELLEGAKLPPYVEIENRTVNIVFRGSNGTLHHWTIGVDALEDQIKLGFYKREFIPELFLPAIENFYYNVYLPLATFSGASQSDIQEVLDKVEELRALGVTYINLRDKETGELHRVVDFRPFVEKNVFTKVITDLYHDLGDDDKAFVHEVWYIVTQLVTYHSEITETPRFPLETIIGAGGDCEDIAILVASMLKAAPANYTVKLVYMDANNPTDPKEVNHVAVWIETPSGYKTFIDGTSKTSMCPFEEIDGWYLEV